MHRLATAALACLLLGPPLAAQGRPAAAPRTTADVLDLSRGARTLGAGDPAGALDLLLPYVDRHPDSAVARFLAGVAHQELGQLTAARVQLEASLALDGSDTTARVVLARVLGELGRLDESVEQLERVVALEPEDARHWTALGMACLQADRLVDAHQALVTAVRGDPTELTAHLGLARILSVVGDRDGALRSYRTAASLDPGDPGLAVTLGHALRDAGRPDEALDSYRRAAELAPGEPWIAANLGSTLLELDRPAEALRRLERALGQLAELEGEGPSPDLALVHLNHGEALLRLGDLLGAREAFEAAVDADPTLGRAHRLLGELLLDQDRSAGARWHLDAALALGSLPGELLLELTLLHERAGDGAAARACAEQLLAGGAGAQASLQRAALQLRSGLPEVADPRAAADGLRSLVAGPLRDHAGTWALLGQALEHGGDAEAARRALERSHELTARQTRP